MNPPLASISTLAERYHEIRKEKVNNVGLQTVQISWYAKQVIENYSELVCAAFQWVL